MNGLQIVFRQEDQRVFGAGRGPHRPPCCPVARQLTG